MDSDAQALERLVLANESWLMRRILRYAHERDYTRYTSTLEEAWRASIRGLTASLVEGLQAHGGVPELDPEERYDREPMAAFGVLEAQRHRERGIRLDMFLGLMRYYQRAYLDLVDEQGEGPAEARARWRRWVTLFFDRVELGFVSEWQATGAGQLHRELQDRNRRLTNEKNLYLTAFESLPSPAFLLGRGGQIVHANPVGAAVLGVAAGPGTHDYGDGLAYPPAPGWLQDAFARLGAAGEAAVESEVTLPGPDGARTCLARVSALLDVSLKFQGATAILTDVTALRAAEAAATARSEALARSNADLDRFAYAVSHDLQEPLRMMSAYADLLGRRYRGRLDPDADEFIGYMVDGAARMKGLIDGLLAFSRASTRAPALEPVALDRALDRALANLRLAIGEAGAEIVRAPLPVVLADVAQIAQVFQNLVGNAVKFRGEARPVVRVRSERRGDHWCVSVSDEGIGIPKEAQRRLFEVFQRAHADAGFPGHGIGLAVCRRIVEHHGGAIWLDSEPGRGTTMTFSLRAAEPARTAVAAAQGAPPGVPGG